MTTAEVGFLSNQESSVGISFRPIRENETAGSVYSSLNVRPINPHTIRKSESRKKVLRRMKGFLIEMRGAEYKVGLVEGETTYEYYMPSSSLKKAGIDAENLPFEMDEVEISTDSGVVVGYEFRPLAKRTDAFQDSFSLDSEHLEKRDLILREFRNAQA